MSHSSDMSFYISLILLIAFPIIAFILGRHTGKGLNGTSQDSLYTSPDTPKLEEDIAVLNARMVTLAQKLEDMNAREAKNQGEAGVLMRSIHSEMHTMTSTLLDKKTRGAWGEYQLKQLLSDYMGNSPRVVEYQYQLSNGKRVDAAIHIPQTYKILAVDSKFPLENYRLMMNAEGDTASVVYQQSRRSFMRDVKGHIDKISQDYSMSQESIGDALMFVPSEAIYTEICSSDEDLLNYALSSNVILTSPTTLIGMTSSILRMTHEYEMRENMERVLEDLRILSREAERLEERAQKLDMRQRQMGEEIHNITVTAHKLAQQLKQF